MAKMGIVWDRTTAFVGERLGALAPITLATLVAPAVASSCLSVAFAMASPGTRMGVGVLAVLLSLVSFWGTLVVMALATGDESLAAAGRAAARRLPATLLVSLALGLAFVALAVPLGLILVARGYDVTAMAAGQGGSVVVDPQTSAMVALWMLVLVAVCLFAFARLVLVSAVVLRERVAFAAIRRSWALTRGHGWRIFGMLLLFLLIATIAQLAAQAVFGSVFALLLGNAPGLTAALVLTTIVTACVQGAAMLLLAAFQGKLYVALTTNDSVWPA
ncbi:hypothetical protein [Sphingomonas sp. ABOLE]|uniref:hypothetical protein n=1 Tax=Sphingomonas sp. ABOLE TaxID=1985878 RepID=UPI000F7EDCCC|nr:hypothetical protein [Sphingomonas sp. ABOLE]